MSFRGFFGGLLTLTGCLSVFVGASLVLHGLYDLFSDQRFLWAAKEVETTVVRIEEKTLENGPVYRPTLSIVSDDARTIEYAGNTWSFPKRHQADEVVEAYYQPNSGVIVSEAMFSQGARVRNIGFKVGTSQLLFGVALLWLRKRRRSKAS
ncbi:MAG: hypothetical protein ABJN14_11625 [Paracoccaceae bacterium]